MLGFLTLLILTPHRMGMDLATESASEDLFFHLVSLPPGNSVMLHQIFVAGVCCNQKRFFIACMTAPRPRQFGICSDVSRCFGQEEKIKQMRWISWLPPSGTRIALNVDDSSMGNPGRAGYGGLLRDINGSWLCGFAGQYGVSNNIHMEILAIFYGLEVAWNRGYRDVECRSNCLEVLHLIEDGCTQFHAYATIIFGVKELLKRNWRVSFHHTLREGNQCADFTKNALSLKVESP
ncbi:hypothetical protein RIF29_24760 [Crotalaria pallida]|uniref:RNase H type-1 domain-containing protein n=1 Tax=Crotalaria pallida TaxID=3830 RepID=A0AAN9EL44_CROPI